MDERERSLASASFRLDETEAGQRLAAALSLLDSALEVFPPSTDPVDDIEGYAVRRALLALRAAFSNLPGP